MLPHTSDKLGSESEKAHFNDLKVRVLSNLESTKNTSISDLKEGPLSKDIKSLLKYFGESFRDELRALLSSDQNKSLKDSLSPWKEEVEEVLGSREDRDEALIEIRAVISKKTSELRMRLREKLEENEKEFVYHGPTHIMRAMDSALSFLDQARQQGVEGITEDTVTMLKLIVLVHDLYVGDKKETLNTKRDEVVSARALKDIIYDQFDLDKATPERRKAFDELIQEMQVAIIATTVNKKDADPVAYGGETTIKQFDLIDQLKLDDGIDNITHELAEALGYKEGAQWASLDDKLRNAKDNILAKIMCNADLAYFGSEIAEDESKDEFLEMAIKYGIEIDVLKDANDLEGLRKYLTGQIDYLTNYKFPQIKGVSDDLEENKEKRVAWLKIKVKDEAFLQRVLGGVVKQNLNSKKFNKNKQILVNPAIAA